MGMTPLKIFLMAGILAVVPAGAEDLLPKDLLVQPGRLKTPKSQEKKKEVLPELSAEGRRKIQADLKVLSENIRQMSQNLSASRDNVGILESELQELTSLEKEHEQLRKNYERYLKIASDALLRNQAAERELASFEKKVLPQVASREDLKNLPPDVQTKLKALEAQGQERRQWEEDTKAKAGRVQQLLIELEGSLRDVRARLGPIREQLEQWKQRERRFAARLEVMEKQKTYLEAQLKDRK